MSDGGVHSSDRHLKALIELAGGDAIVHAFTDGRDTDPKGGAKYLADVESWGGRVGSVVGRYFAMDRDKRWDRIQKAYDLLVARQGRAPRGHRARRPRKAAYERGETDEFIEPTTVGEEATIRPGDSVIAFNFRPDRMREITLALTDPDFDEVDRDGADVIERYTTLAEYDEDWSYPVVFPPKRPSMTIGKVIARPGQGAAARRRDREVPARDVLLQRRRGGPVRRARCASSCRPRATSRPTTTSRR